MIVTAPLPRARGPQAPAAKASGGRPLRLARRLALAYEIERLLRTGVFARAADVARALGVSRARITQLLDLLLLNPRIQEDILDMGVAHGRDPLTERDARKIVRAAEWGEQQRRWDEMLARKPRRSSELT